MSYELVSTAQKLIMFYLNKEASARFRLFTQSNKNSSVIG